MYYDIQEGKVIPKRGLTRFTENGAVFEDGSEIQDIDLVVFATGFDMDLDFIDVPGIKGRLPEILSKYFLSFSVKSDTFSTYIISSSII